MPQIVRISHSQPLYRGQASLATPKGQIGLPTPLIRIPEPPTNHANLHPSNTPNTHFLAQPTQNQHPIPKNNPKTPLHTPHSTPHTPHSPLQTSPPCENTKSPSANPEKAKIHDGAKGPENTRGEKGGINTTSTRRRLVQRGALWRTRGGIGAVEPAEIAL